MKRLRAFRLTEEVAAALVFAAVAVLPVAISFNPYYLSIFISALILGAVSIAWNLLAGVCGQVSFGHAGFFGIGAYVSAILVMKAGWNPYIAMGAAGLAGVTGALLIGIPAFRLRGPYFALAILGFAEVMKLLAVNLTGLTEGSQGIFNVPPLPGFRVGGVVVDFYVSGTPNYYFAAVLMLAVYLAAYFLRRSNTGLAMFAVQGDEETAAGIGVPVLRTKLVALTVSAFSTALMGAFYTHYVHFLSPDMAFDGYWTVMPVVGSLFGGMGTLIGPGVGSLVITGLDEFVFKRFFETGHKLFFGLLLAVVIVWAPSGLLGRRVRKTTHGGKG
ncbi:MAG: branched-chain amino acid ABC transporter permease [Deltaproteobacteria bacterium]|nr:branched-chain amino acid ABC transporter permease [Deltaproteobacteria bacterium]